MIKKVDIHAHVRPEDPQSQNSKLDPVELSELYDRLNIERGIILPFISLKASPGILTAENARLIAEKFPERFSYFTTVDLNFDNVDGKSYDVFLREEKEKGALGVGEITSRFYFDDKPVERLFEAAEKNDMPLLFHMACSLEDRYGVADDSGLFRMEKMLKKYPTVKFIGHANAFWSEISYIESEEIRPKRPKGKVFGGRLSPLMRECPNLYCDLSARSGSNAMMRDEEFAASFMEEFQDRIFYGCDICCKNEEYPFEFASFFDSLYENGKITRTTYQKIARENALKLIRK